MTYGDVAGELRTSMTWLLQRHDTTNLIGRNREELRIAGEAMLRYRTAVITWCLQAVAAASPSTDLERTTSLWRNPGEELRYRLQRAVSAGPHEPALADLLQARHTSQYVAVWQSAARAAVIGEREVASAISWAHRPAEQNDVAIKDASDIVRAVSVLEGRYANIPGWQKLPHPQPLVRAADLISIEVARRPRDFSVDQLGWRPTPGVIQGPALPGIAGVTQAQHNVAAELGHFPSALNLRRVLLSQTHLSRQVARIAEAAESSLAPDFRDRAALYADLTRAGRNLGGLIGGGARAAIESGNAADLASRTGASDASSAALLRRLHHLCTRVDVRVAGAIERGFAENLYFVSTELPRLADRPRAGTRPLHQEWIPVDSPRQAPILHLARSGLQPPPAAPASHGGQGQESRLAYEAVVEQQQRRNVHATRR